MFVGRLFLVSSDVGDKNAMLLTGLSSTSQHKFMYVAVLDNDMCSQETKFEEAKEGSFDDDALR